LIPLRPEHIRVLHGWRLERNTRRFNPTATLTYRQYRAILSRVSSNLRHKREGFRWMIEAGGDVVGSVSLQVNPKMKYGEIGYLLAQKHQGKGLGGKAVAQFVDKIFRESKLERLVAQVAEKNLASRALLERIGFVQEGILRQHFIVRGKRVNEVYYGLLRSEWLERARRGTVPSRR